MLRKIFDVSLSVCVRVYLEFLLLLLFEYLIGLAMARQTGCLIGQRIGMAIVLKTVLLAGA